MFGFTLRVAPIESITYAGILWFGVRQLMFCEQEDRNLGCFGCDMALLSDAASGFRLSELMIYDYSIWLSITVPRNVFEHSESAGEQTEDFNDPINLLFARKLSQILIHFWNILRLFMRVWMPFQINQIPCCGKICEINSTSSKETYEKLNDKENERTRRSLNLNFVELFRGEF